MVVDHADGTLVIPLGRQEGDDHLPVLLQTIGVGVDDHAFQGACGAGGSEFAPSFHFHQAEPAGADIRNAVQMAECGNVDSVLPGDLQQRLIVLCAELFAVDSQGDDRHVQVPAKRDCWCRDRSPRGQTFRRLSTALRIHAGRTGVWRGPDWVRIVRGRTGWSL